MYLEFAKTLSVATLSAYETRDSHASIVINPLGHLIAL